MKPKQGKPGISKRLSEQKDSAYVFNVTVFVDIGLGDCLHMPKGCQRCPFLVFFSGWNLILESKGH